MIDPATGRVAHQLYRRRHAVTGRLASSDPNLQTSRARTAEAAASREASSRRPGTVLVSADISQI